MAIRFPTDEAFRVFYDSPEYQAIIGKRLSATHGFALLIGIASSPGCRASR